MPGGMGVNLVRQFDQAGLEMPFLSAFTIDETTLPATQAAAVGRMGGAQWARDLDNPTNATFVETFEAKYGYAPSLYASQGYDTALILDAALAEAGTTEAEALSAALKGIEMETTRGDFRFGANNFPVQDFYLVEAVEMDGQYVMQSVQQVFEDRVDAYAAECRM
jgi:branched-chain amino acid transport system substrate-binding protein